MLSDVLDRQHNSFNVVRLFAAICVVVSHAYVVRDGMSVGEPLLPLTPYTLGQHAVNGFFVISGLMLSLSLHRQPSASRFVWARCLRIVPGLFVCGALVAYALGPVMTNASVSTYFSNLHTWLYPVAVIVLFARATPPQGLFTSVPLTEAVNDPLWTIKYELGCYLALVALQVTGIVRWRWALIVITVVAAAVLVAKPWIAISDGASDVLNHVSRFGLCFMLGILAFAFRCVVPITPALLLTSFAVAVATTGTWFAPVAYIVLVAHLVLIVGAADFGAFTKITRTTDVSFGTYIYAWPIQQTIVVLAPELSVVSMIAASLAIVLPLAWLSWRLIERPALEFKQRYDREGATAFAQSRGQRQ